MQGYDDATYGDRFADVYDDWYGDDVDTDAAVDALAGLAAGRTVLELGVGTGRLALPLARRGLAVTGLDSSQAMLDRLATKDGGDSVRPVLGTMEGPLPEGPFGLVFVARNTLFNCTADGAHERCLRAAAAVLEPGGAVVVEAFVPDDSPERSSVSVRSVEADRVVLFVDRHDPDTQEAWSSIVELTPSGNRFRPAHIRYATPDQLDAVAARAGLVLTERWADWTRAPFGPDSEAHVSVYRLAEPAP